MARQVTPAVLAGFFDEVRGYLPRIRDGVDRHLREPTNRDSLEEVHRLLHSIKGTASMVGQGEVSRIAGEAEAWVEESLRGSKELGEADARRILAATEHMDGLTRTGTNPSGAVSPVTDAQLADAVAEELRGYLDQIGASLRGLENDPEGNAMAEIWRPIHTIKGTAGIVGMHEVSQLAHRMEDLLTSLDRGQQTLDPTCKQLLFQTSDLLADLVEGSAGDEGGLDDRLAKIYRAYSDRLDTAPTAGDRAAASAKAEPISIVPIADETEQVTAAVARPAGSFLRVRADRLDGILRLAGDVTLQRSAFDQQVTRLNELRNELQLNLRRLGRIGRQLETELDRGGHRSGGVTLTTGVAAEFDSLEMDRYTTLDRLARQFEEATSDSAAVGSGFDVLLREIEGFQGRLGQLTHDMQDRLAQLRTVPFGSLSERLHRAVRVTAERRGKRASLTIVGADVELDKNVIDEISEPLQHMLRNAVDHGIEAPDQRTAAGKPRTGSITIELALEGTEAVLRMRDDGAGLRLEGIREQAIARGTLSVTAAREATDTHLYQLLFQRGFSLAKTVSDVSGRGVGLDIVQAAMDRLRGALDVDSRPGDGTTFTMRLPGSQTILRVLLVSSGGEMLAIPLASVDRVERVAAGALTDRAGVLSLSVDDETMPALELETTLGLRPDNDQGASQSQAILLRVAGQRLALLVARILGVQETVVRPLSTLFARRVYGLGGAALTGDGQVVLVLNPNDLVREAPPVSQPQSWREPRSLEVLIVDDSLSVRQVLSRLVERNGWRALAARDGEEALACLNAAPRVPNVAIVDLEMPRMDGFELTRSLRAHPLFRHLPIVILTTRAGQKHRQKALDLGANDYLVKPYNDETLLRTIQAAAQLASEAVQ